jgi:hypothetical protein
VKCVLQYKSLRDLGFAIIYFYSTVSEILIIVYLNVKKLWNSSPSPLTHDCVCAQEHINFIVCGIRDSGKYLTSDRFFVLLNIYNLVANNVMSTVVVM